MVVWIINHYAQSPTDQGGVRHFWLARHLNQRGHRSVIFASSFDHFSRHDIRVNGTEKYRHTQIEGVDFCWLQTPSYKNNSFGRLKNMMAFTYRLLAGTGRGRLQPPDVIIGSSPHLFAAFAAEKLARKMKVPFIMEVRDIWPLAQVEIANVNPRHPMVLLQEQIERYLYRKSARIISLLPNAADHICAHGGQADKIRYVPNGIDLNLVPLPQPPQPTGTFTLIYAGAHGTKNALDTLIDAASLLQRENWGQLVRFRLIGSGSEKVRLQERARQENITQVTFEDPVPRTKIYDLLVQGDAFIINRHDHPINRFGISTNKIFDYLAMARPTVFASKAFNNPFAESGAGITVPPGDTPAIVAAIKKLVNMPPQERWEMGLRGRRYVEENHEYTKLTERLEKMINEVIETRPRHINS